jgi:palmitoyl transferase
MRNRLFRSILALLVAAPLSAHAGPLDAISQVVQQGTSEVLIPGWAWHNPSTYSSAERARLNDRNVGIGFARVLSDQSTTRIVYGMAFEDSNRNVEPIAGYAQTWDWEPAGGVRLGFGYTAGVTSRRDLFHGIPTPLLLPVASVQIGKSLSLYATYVPPLGRHHDASAGNIAFVFAGWRF